MKRLIIDLHADSSSFSRHLYHPFTSPTDGIQSYGLNSPTQSLEKEILEYLQEVPNYDETVNQTNPVTLPGYALIHVSRLANYDLLIADLQAKLKEYETRNPA